METMTSKRTTAIALVSLAVATAGTLLLVLTGRAANTMGDMAMVLLPVAAVLVVAVIGALVALAGAGILALTRGVRDDR